MPFSRFVGYFLLKEQFSGRREFVFRCESSSKEALGPLGGVRCSLLSR